MLLRIFANMTHKPKMAESLGVKKPTSPQAGPRPKITPRGGYRGARDDEGLTPRQRLDALKADLAAIELQKAHGELVLVSEVDAGHAEMRDVIRSDLLGTLPLRIAGQLAGRGPLDAREIREAVLVAVREIIAGWAAGGLPVPAGG